MCPLYWGHDREGRLRDIGLKGSGRTRFSRMGDGRAVLGPMLREYLISEAMAALGVPTTRSLAVIATGHGVRRETIQPGAILTRVAASHLRVGSFQYARIAGEDELGPAAPRLGQQFPGDARVAHRRFVDDDERVSK